MKHIKLGLECTFKELKNINKINDFNIINASITSRIAKGTNSSYDNDYIISIDIVLDGEHDLNLPNKFILLKNGVFYLIRKPEIKNTYGYEVNNMVEGEIFTFMHIKCRVSFYGYLKVNGIPVHSNDFDNNEVMEIINKCDNELEFKDKMVVYQI